MTSAFVPVYATLADLVAYAPAEVQSELPTGTEATRLLTSASMTIAKATKTSIYPTDSTGLPSMEPYITGFKRATCAQAVWWLETGDELGVAGSFANVSIGGLTLARGGRGDTTTVTGVQLAPQALIELEICMARPNVVTQIQAWEQSWP
jgi:hypothetical protein